MFQWGLLSRKTTFLKPTLRKFWSLKVVFCAVELRGMVVGSQVLPCSEQQSEWSQFGEAARKSHRRVEVSTHTENIQADTISGISTPHHTWIKQLFIVRKYNLNYLHVAMLTASIVATKQGQQCLISVTRLILILIALCLTHVHSGSGLYNSNYCHSKKIKNKDKMFSCGKYVDELRPTIFSALALCAACSLRRPDSYKVSEVCGA